MIATLAAAAALLLGDGPHNRGVDVLGPDLRPVTELPAKAHQVDVAPDGRLAVGTARGIVIEGRRFRVRSDHRVLSWLTDDALAVVKRGKPTTVRILSPSAGRVVHREKLRERFVDTSRVGDRQLVLTQERLHVFAPDGALERTVELPGVTFGELRGNLVLFETTLYDLDVATGALTTHTVPPGSWLNGDRLAIVGDGVHLLDPVTFAVTRTVRTRGTVRGAGDGFLQFDTEGPTRLKVFDAAGDVRWARDLQPLDAYAAGDLVYTGSGYDDVTLRAFDLATGRLVHRQPGRAYLFGPSLGRLRVPFFSSSAISED